MGAQRSIAVTVNVTTIGYLRCSLSRGDIAPEEFVRFAEIVKDNVFKDDRQFFMALAKRRDPEVLLRLVFAMVSRPEDRRRIVSKGREVYGGGALPVQPKLLEIIEQFA